MRRTVLKTLLAAPAAIALPRLAFAQGKPEKSKLTIAVGGKNLFYYLPLTIAEQLGYFKDEGLQVEIPDFAGGAKALQALVGGSADVVSGAYEHTINMQAKNQPIMSVVLQGRAPQIVMAVSTKTMPGYKSIADLKGKKIGVTAPGSSTAMMASYVLAKAGLKASDVSFIGVGASSGAIAAVKSGQVDAIANLDPVITMLQRDNLIKVVADTRTLKDTQAVYGGPMPAACLYTPVKFVQDNPGTTQALANAMVRALRWLQKAGPSDIVKRARARGHLARRPDARGRPGHRAAHAANLRGQPEGQAHRPGQDLHQQLRQEGRRQVRLSPGTAWRTRRTARWCGMFLIAADARPVWV